MFKQLAVYTCCTRRHGGLNHTCGQCLRKLGSLHGHGLSAYQFSNAGSGGAVCTPLDALQIGYAVERLFAVNALGRPSHRVQKHHALVGQLLLQQRLLRLVELHGLVIAVGQKGQAVNAKGLPFVLEVHQQNLAQLGLAALNSALNFRGLEQRRVGVNRDFELASCGFVDIGSKLGHVDGVEVGGRVGGGQVPFGLGRCQARKSE